VTFANLSLNPPISPNGEGQTIRSGVGSKRNGRPGALEVEFSRPPVLAEPKEMYGFRVN